MRQKAKLILTLFLLIGAMGMAKQEPPTPNPPPTPEGLPVDSGVLILLAAGVFYGLKKKLKH